MRAGVVGLIFSKDRKAILLVKRRDCLAWVVPGGGVEERETLEKAVAREVDEETGYEIRIVRKSGVYERKMAIPGGKTYAYECEIISGRAKLGPETIAVASWNLRKLPRQLPFYQKEWVFDAARSTKGMTRRKQTISRKRLLFYGLRSPEVAVLFGWNRLARYIKSWLEWGKFATRP